MKLLPYFRWYPADAETDAQWRLMDDTDRGYFMRLLDYSWLNDGIPADEKKRARAMQVHVNYDRARWKALGPLWVTHPSRGEYLQNPRQELERIHAITRSERALESVKHRIERSIERSSRAYESVSVSGVKNLKASNSEEISTPIPPPNVKAFPEKRRPIPESKFPVWFEGFQGRKADEDSAARAWLSVDADAAGDLPFLCRDRYNQSREVSEGTCMEAAKFIFQQGRNNWGGQWPKAQPKKQSFGEWFDQYEEKANANG